MSVTPTHDVFRATRLRIREQIDDGKNEEALRTAEEALLHELKDAPPKIIRGLLNEQARAFRNLGRITDALRCYSLALESASAEGSIAAETWELVLLAKIFDKYLHRHAFVHACLAEARARYERHVEVHGNERGDPETRRYAILLDLVGSYYRRLADRDPAYFRQAVHAYEEALGLQQLSGNRDGVARAQCHLAYTRASQAFHLPDDDPARMSRIREAILLFDAGFRYVTANEDAYRGRATRQAQRAHLYFFADQKELAEDFVLAAMDVAVATHDMRAYITAALIYATIVRSLGRPKDAIRLLQEARNQSGNSQLFGLRRKINNALVECSLELNRRAHAFNFLDENDNLIREELEQFDVAYGAVFELFRRVAPASADRYLFEGLKMETAGVVSEILQTERAARRAFSTFERMSSAEMQNAVYDLALQSLGHDVKNRLNHVTLGLGSASAALARGEDIRAMLVDLRAQVEGVARSAPVLTNADDSKTAYLVESIRRLACDLLGGERVVVKDAFDVELPGLSRLILDGAITHLIENAEKAIAEAPPANGTPLIRISHRRRGGAADIFIHNPGKNPLATPIRANDREIHGFQAAKQFLSKLGLDCHFSTTDEGPCTEGFRSNCVTITVPAAVAHDRGYIFIEAPRP